MSKTDWWRGAAIYQIYPRSFLDTNNNGIGDINGITEKLSYILDLGMDGIWISPFFPSPMKDFGYDISNYRDIDPIFGTLNDFEKLLNEAHNLGLKIIIDLVLSHTSDQHPWFSDPDKKDWYIWADGKTDNNKNPIPPNNWVSVFGGSAWQWDKRYSQYYLHNFLKEQPDLNYHNKDVQDEALDIAKFWFDMGVDGFRLDTVNFYFHDKKLRDNPARSNGTKYATQLEKQVPYSMQQHIYDKSRPENLNFIARLRKLADSYPNRVLIGEIGDDHPYERAREYTKGNKHLHTSYNPHMMSGIEKELTEDLIRTPIDDYYKKGKSDKPNSNKINTEITGWASWAFSNHDVVRAASRWFKLYRHNEELSKTLMVLLGCLPGTIFIYQGEELGLPEAKIPLEYIKDPWARETLPQWQGRDGCRSPMVWSEEKPYNGFSKSSPWLPIPNTHKNLNVCVQSQDKHSTLNTVKKFYNWRKNRKEFFNEDYKFINTNNSKIIHIIRKYKNNETNCIFNLSDKKQNYLTHKMEGFSFIIETYNG